MPYIAPIAFQLSQEQQQAINKIADSLRPLLGSSECVLLTSILQKEPNTAKEDDPIKRSVEKPETAARPKQETFTVAEAATLLNVNRATVYRLIYAGRLKILSSFGHIRISR
jgi:excisionase family DNA binding protein